MGVEQLQAMEEEYNILKNEYEILSSKKSKLFREILEARREIRKPIGNNRSQHPSFDMINAQFGIIETVTLLLVLKINAPQNVTLVPDIFPIADFLKYRDMEIVLCMVKGISYKNIAITIGVSPSRVAQIVQDIKKKIKHPRAFRKLYTYNEEK